MKIEMENRPLIGGNARSLTIEDLSIVFDEDSMVLKGNKHFYGTEDDRETATHLQRLFERASEEIGERPAGKSDDTIEMNRSSGHIRGYIRLTGGKEDAERAGNIAEFFRHMAKRTAEAAKEHEGSGNPAFGNAFD